MHGLNYTCEPPIPLGLGGLEFELVLKGTPLRALRVVMERERSIPLGLSYVPLFEVLIAYEGGQVGERGRNLGTRRCRGAHAHAQ